jgi:hypothetical protein
VFPNVNFKDSGIELGKGIKVNRFLETKIFMPLGTAEQHEAIDLRRPIAVWYTGE